MPPKDLIYYFIIGLCMDVHNELGKGFSEVVFSNALELELKSNGVPYKNQKLKHHYYADFVVDNEIIIELKAISSLTQSHTKQKHNYLVASKFKLGL